MLINYSVALLVDRIVGEVVDQYSVSLSLYGGYNITSTITIAKLGGSSLYLIQDEAIGGVPLEGAEGFVRRIEEEWRRYEVRARAYGGDPDPFEFQQRLERKLWWRRLLRQYDVDWGKAIAYALRSIYLYGPLTTVFLDKRVTDVYVPARGNVYVEHIDYGQLTTSIPRGLALSILMSKLPLRCNTPASRYAGAISVSDPLFPCIADSCDVVQPLRISIVTDPFVAAGAETAHVRPIHALTPYDIVRGGTAPEVLALLWAAYEEKVPILIIGQVGSGKTTLAYVTSSLLPSYKGRAFVASQHEIPMISRSALYLVERQEVYAGQREVSVDKLLSIALKSGREYITVAEITDRRTLATFLEAIHTGHGGISTIHASSPEDLVERVRGMGFPPSSLNNVVVAKMELERVRSKLGWRTLRYCRNVWIIKAGSTLSLVRLVAEGRPLVPYDEELVERVKFIESLVEDGVKDVEVLMRRVDDFYLGKRRRSETIRLIASEPRALGARVEQQGQLGPA